MNRFEMMLFRMAYGYLRAKVKKYRIEKADGDPSKCVIRGNSISGECQINVALDKGTK